MFDESISRPNTYLARDNPVERQQGKPHEKVRSVNLYHKQLDANEQKSLEYRRTLE